MTDKDKHTDIPIELKDKLAILDTSLTSLETNLHPLLKTTLSEMNSKLEALERAKMDLVAVYAINSLFWVYLNVNGINPKEHPIKQELDRIRGYMARVKEIQDKVKAPKLDKPAAKRFVKSALWQAALKQTFPDKPEVNQSKEENKSQSHDNSASNDSPKNVVQSKGDNSQRQSRSSLWKAAQQKASSNKRSAEVSESTSTPPHSKKKSKKHK